MSRDFDYLLKKHGKEGSRPVFEDACTKAFTAEYKNAHTIKCDPGDDGIDIYVGDFQEPIEVYQCKCFFYSIEEVQKKQIRESFEKAIKSKNFTVKKWCLCVPKSFTIEETKWWSKWKKAKETKHGITIDLYDSVKLLNLIRKNKIDLEIFDEEERLMLVEILDRLEKKEERLKEILSPPDDIDYTERIFTLKLKSAKIEEHSDIYNKQFFNAEILTKEVQSKGIEEDLKELKSLKDSIQEMWLTQYLMYEDEEDGNKLLGLVNLRIEDFNSKQLKTHLDMSVSEKKGVLHQLADECTVGWVKNYKNRLKVFLEKNIGDATT